MAIAASLSSVATSKFCTSAASAEAAGGAVICATRAAGKSDFVPQFILGDVPGATCVFRLLSTKPQPPGGTMSRPPAGCALGAVGNPFDRVWPPTTSGHLQPIFSCVDSRGTHPLCVYVREYGMWYVRGYVLGEEGVNASTSRGRNSKLEG